jgi:hypothetical protein
VNGHVVERTILATGYWILATGYWILATVLATVKHFTGRPDGSFDLPHGRSTIVAERIERANLGEDGDLVAAKPDPPDQIVD